MPGKRLTFTLFALAALLPSAGCGCRKSCCGSNSSSFAPPPGCCDTALPPPPPGAVTVPSGYLPVRR